jgi:hypothetical protein
MQPGSMIRTGPYKFNRDREGVARLTPKLFLRIQDETLLVPIVLVRKGLFCGAMRVGFSTS